MSDSIRHPLTPYPGKPACRASLAVLGTPLQVTGYADWSLRCVELARRPAVTVVDFTNTHIVAARRHEPAFRSTTRRVDFFVPDGMPLIWLLNRQGAGLRDRVYGPTFMRRFLEAASADQTHFLLGASPACLERLRFNLRQWNPGLRIVGAQHGYFRADEEDAVVASINQLSPDFLWVGLGTPKQQEWVERNRDRIRRGVIFMVGFAFDVNAGTKPDAPAWVQRAGLTWLFRILAEPRRLAGRYLKYNSLFLFYLVWDGLRGRVFERREQ